MTTQELIDRQLELDPRSCWRTPCGIRGYERIDWTPPSEGFAGTRQDILDSPEYAARTKALGAVQAALKPWTLLAMPGDSHSIVARRRTLLMRLLTWWRNRRRRREVADVARARAAYFSPEQVAARMRASQ